MCGRRKGVQNRMLIVRGRIAECTTLRQKSAADECGYVECIIEAESNYSVLCFFEETNTRMSAPADRATIMTAVII